MFKKCNICAKVYETRRGHTCYMSYCENCGMDKPHRHKCFVKKLEVKKKKSNDPDPETKFLFYGFESTQEKILENGEKEHVPNLCIVQRCCTLYGSEEQSDNTDDFKCPLCFIVKEAETISTRGQKKFEGANIVEDFCDWVFDGTNRGAIAVAHNNRGYDVFFIIQYLHTQGIKPCNVIQVGQKILSFQAEGFNTEENQNYEGSIPDFKFFNPDSMSPEGRRDFSCGMHNRRMYNTISKAIYM
jgi:hypothetical protein